MSCKVLIDCHMLMPVCVHAGQKMQLQQQAVWSCWVLSWSLSSGLKQKKACSSR